jgi:hypothetical protein
VHAAHENTVAESSKAKVERLQHTPRYSPSHGEKKRARVVRKEGKTSTVRERQLKPCNLRSRQGWGSVIAATINDGLIKPKERKDELLRIRCSLLLFFVIIVAAHE